MIGGIAATVPGDEPRIARGAALLDVPYVVLSARNPAVDDVCFPVYGDTPRTPRWIECG